MPAGRMMTEGEKRRMNILEILENRTAPVSGTEESWHPSAESAAR